MAVKKPEHPDNPNRIRRNMDSIEPQNDKKTNKITKNLSIQST